ncbi:hypothetical protein HD806DRAFT_537725 [Xylariaceae sp. AK1471]|nr:hypothetical protein HD806DRAFT_537725 [Xylariaceae sp. AK1471]
MNLQDIKSSTDSTQCCHTAVKAQTKTYGWWPWTSSGQFSKIILEQPAKDLLRVLTLHRPLPISELFIIQKKRIKGLAQTCLSPITHLRFDEDDRLPSVSPLGLKLSSYSLSGISQSYLPSPDSVSIMPAWDNSLYYEAVGAEALNGGNSITIKSLVANHRDPLDSNRVKGFIQD